MQSSLKPPTDLGRRCRRLEAAGRELFYAGRRLHVHRVNLATSAPGYCITPHQHSYYEALLIVDGEAVETVGRRQRLLPGTLQLHAPGTRHGWRTPAAGLCRFAVSFSLAPPVELPADRPWPVQTDAITVLQEMLEQAGQWAPGAKEELQARLLLWLSRFLALLDWSTVETAEDPVASWTLDDTVDQFLRDNLDQALTLADVAIIAGVSVPTLTRQYRATTGVSVMQRFQALRMAAAAQLLRETELPVKEIAVRVGFAESSYFCRRFRQQHGTSPQRYRRS